MHTYIQKQLGTHLLNTNIHTCIHKYKLTKTHTYMHTQIHTYKLTYIHTYIKLLRDIHTTIRTNLHTNMKKKILYIQTFKNEVLHKGMNTNVHSLIHKKNASKQAYMHKF